MSGIVALRYAHRQLNVFPFAVVRLVGGEGEWNQVILLDTHAVDDGFVAVVLVVVDNNGYHFIDIDILVVNSIDIESHAVGIASEGDVTVVREAHTCCVSTFIRGNRLERLTLAGVTSTPQFTIVAAGTVLRDRILGDRQEELLPHSEIVSAGKGRIVTLLQGNLTTVGSRHQLYHRTAVTTDTRYFRERGCKGTIY